TVVVPEPIARKPLDIRVVKLLLRRDLGNRRRRGSVDHHPLDRLQVVLLGKGFVDGAAKQFFTILIVVLIRLRQPFRFALRGQKRLRKGGTGPHSRQQQGDHPSNRHCSTLSLKPTSPGYATSVGLDWGFSPLPKVG